MSTYLRDKFFEIARLCGMDEEDRLEILLTYIENQDDDERFLDHLDMVANDGHCLEEGVGGNEV